MTLSAELKTALTDMTVAIKASDDARLITAATNYAVVVNKLLVAINILARGETVAEMWGNEELTLGAYPTLKAALALAGEALPDDTHIYFARRKLATHTKRIKGLMG